MAYDVPSGQEPFGLTKAADALSQLAKGEVERSDPLEVDMSRAHSDIMCDILLAVY